jgi:hypothetical protein
MLYSTLKVGEKEYKLRLTAQSSVEVEKQLGKSVYDMVLGIAPESMNTSSTKEDISIRGMSMPLISNIVTILHGSLQRYQHSVTLDDTYDIYDEYIDAGGSYMDFFEILMNVLKVSGFLPQEAKAEAAAARGTEQENSPEA